MYDPEKVRQTMTFAGAFASNSAMRAPKRTLPAGRVAIGALVKEMLKKCCAIIARWMVAIGGMSHSSPCFVQAVGLDDIRQVQLCWDESPLRLASELVGLELAYCLDQVVDASKRERREPKTARLKELSLSQEVLTLRAVPCSYSEAVALKETLKRFPRALTSTPLSAPCPLQMQRASLALAVVSDDGCLLWWSSSQKALESYPLWSAFMHQVLQPQDFECGRLETAVSRLLYEELGLALHSRVVPWKFLGAGLCPEGELQLQVLVDFRGTSLGLSAQNICRVSLSAPNANTGTIRKFHAIGARPGRPSEQLRPDNEVSLLKSIEGPTVVQALI